MCERDVSKNPKVTVAAAAERILEEAGEPLHANEIARRAIDRGLAATTGKTPEATFGAILAVSVKNKGNASRFVRTKPATFGLRAWVDEGRVEVYEETERGRVRVPDFPTYTDARAALKAWDGLSPSAITSMRSTIMALTGTPQESLDWSDPDAWIEARLDGEVRDTAGVTWKKSKGQVNPRHTTGLWYLITHYGLLVERDGVLQLSPAGEDFQQNTLSATVQQIDDAEGLLTLLETVADMGPVAPKDLLEPWLDYLQKESRIRADSSARSYLGARLRNLQERAMVLRIGVQYAATDQGVAYLRDAGVASHAGETPIRELIHRELQSVRETLGELLADIDPFAFEHLIKELLVAMNYQDVEVTPRSGDKGVDVVANIELGITSVKEVVQVKRHRPRIQRTVLDALRGSLHRFGAVRGTIITTGDFSRGTREAAFEAGAAPITLIDGDKLIDLLIEHGIGVRKREVELLEVDTGAFRPQGDEE